MRSLFNFISNHQNHHMQQDNSAATLEEGKTHHSIPQGLLGCISEHNIIDSVNTNIWNGLDGLLSYRGIECQGIPTEFIWKNRCQNQLTWNFNKNKCIRSQQHHINNGKKTYFWPGKKKRQHLTHHKFSKKTKKKKTHHKLSSQMQEKV